MGRHKVRTVRARNNEWVRVVRSGSAGGGGGSGGGGGIGILLMIGGLVLCCCILNAVVDFVKEHSTEIVILSGLVGVGYFVATSRR